MSVLVVPVDVEPGPEFVSTPNTTGVSVASGSGEEPGFGSGVVTTSEPEVVTGVEL